MSEVHICNLALSYLGIPPILSRDDNSKPARECNLIFDDRRDELLRLFEWKFATKRTDLSPLSSDPAFEWTYQFNVPSDSLKILFVGSADGVWYPFDYEGNKILVNYDLIYVKYTRRVEDTNEMDPLFRGVLSSYLAQFLALPLGMKSQYSKALELYETSLSEARFNGSVEEYEDKMESEDWLESRI